MSTGNRIRAALMALAASLVLFGASTSKATTVLFSDSGFGFDTSTFPSFDPDITPDFFTDSTTSMFLTGFPMGGPANDVNVTMECQLLGDGTMTASFCNEELNVMGEPGDPWSSQVEWDLQKDENTTGPDGPALILFTRLQDFPTGTMQYEPGQVGIVLESADFKVVAHTSGAGDVFYFLAFMVDGIPDFGNGVVTRNFEYEVTRDIIGINTDEFGTPILRLVTVSVPEPSSSLMMTVGLIGLAYLGRRRG